MEVTVYSGRREDFPDSVVLSLCPSVDGIRREPKCRCVELSRRFNSAYMDRVAYRLAKVLNRNTYFAAHRCMSVTLYYEASDRIGGKVDKPYAIVYDDVYRGPKTVCVCKNAALEITFSRAKFGYPGFLDLGASYESLSLYLNSLARIASLVGLKAREPRLCWHGLVEDYYGDEYRIVIDDGFGKLVMTYYSGKRSRLWVRDSTVATDTAGGQSGCARGERLTRKTWNLVLGMARLHEML